MIARIPVPRALPHCDLLSPIGPITVFEDSGAIVAVEWGRAPDAQETPLLDEARRQLDAYFDGTLPDFDLPLAPTGSPFEQAVWAGMCRIPYGVMRTYGDLAHEVDGSAQAVGGACGANHIPIIIPCHRVVGADGHMVGYSGAGGVETKQALLRLEGALLV
jgi:methylated-DNA-[protein]-cysteine S-methyltransferase